jgi:hypothetical protein
MNGFEVAHINERGVNVVVVFVAPAVGDSSRKGNLRTLRISEGAWRACSVNWQA